MMMAKAMTIMEVQINEAKNLKQEVVEVYTLVFVLFGNWPVNPTKKY